MFITDDEITNPIEKLEEARAALDEANVLMCNAIKNYVEDRHLSKKDGDCKIKLTFNEGNKVDVASNTPIIGLVAERRGKLIFIYFFDEDWNDDIDDSDLSANELYEVTSILSKGAYTDTDLPLL